MRETSGTRGLSQAVISAGVVEVVRSQLEQNDSAVREHAIKTLNVLVAADPDLASDVMGGDMLEVMVKLLGAPERAAAFLSFTVQPSHGLPPMSRLSQQDYICNRQQRTAKQDVVSLIMACCRVKPLAKRSRQAWSTTRR